MDLHHRAELRASRVLWLLPWALVLVVSTSLAYAMNVAVRGDPSAELAPVDVSPAPTPDDPPAAGALFYDEEVEAACDHAPCRRVRRWLPGSCDTRVDGRRTLFCNGSTPAQPKVPPYQDGGA